MLPKSVPQCRHTKTDGMRCGSPAMRGHSFCYYHARMRADMQRASSADARQLPLQLPPLEDAHSIQLALMEIGRAIVEDRISDKKAGLLLYMLQTASINLKRLEEDRSEELVRQDYPEAAEEMERLKRESARDPEEQRQESLAEILLKGLGIHPDQPPPQDIPPDETPTWWEVQAGYKQPLPSQTTQSTHSGTEEFAAPGENIPDIHGMADHTTNRVNGVTTVTKGTKGITGTRSMKGPSIRGTRGTSVLRGTTRTRVPHSCPVLT